MNKYLLFLETENTGKTKRFTVDKQGQIGGIIKWSYAWKKYCFYTVHDFVFDYNCLKEIGEFLNSLNKKT